ncbi:MAG: hypothetical protein AAB874_08025 [Patescibacteria group bacterium]
MNRTKSLFFGILLFQLSTIPIHASDVALASASVKFEITETDPRVMQLTQFLESHQSPMATYAASFLKTADLYNLPDWRLVPAISGVESSFGKHIPYNSYNAYGWANGEYRFENWEQSIELVTKTLKEKYIDHGRDTVEEIAPVYAPPSTTWAGKVRFFMRKIGEYQNTSAKTLGLTI